MNQYINKTKVQINCIIVFCFFTHLANSQFVPTQRSLQKTQDKIIELFGSDVVFTTLEANSNYYKISRKDSLIAYYCIEQAPSKHDHFEFLVIYSSDIKIQHVSILVYREDYGYEIKSKRWLKQFSTRDTPKVQAISGATISVNSLKKHVERLTEKMESIIL